MTDIGPWKRNNSRIIYRNSFLYLEEDDVERPDGTPSTYAYVSLKNGVGAVAIDDTGHVHLVRQFRYPMNSETLEIICGSVEEGESPERAALRELREEAGIGGAILHYLGGFDLDTSVVIGKADLFLARITSLEDAAPQGPESSLSVLRVPLRHAVHMAYNGRITHAPSCVGLLRAWQHLGGRLSESR